MADFQIALRIRDASGVLVLELEDEANGYWIPDGGMPAEDRPVVRTTSRSPWVDGSDEPNSTYDSNVVSIQVRVFGTTWAQCEQRVQALVAAVDRGTWLLEQVIEGVSKTWRANRVEPLIPPVSVDDLVNLNRYVTLTFPVQPTAVITFPEEA